MRAMRDSQHPVARRGHGARRSVLPSWSAVAAHDGHGGYVEPIVGRRDATMARRQHDGFDGLGAP